MLLGFIVSEHGIKANPKKVSAITSMGPICNLVMGCLMSLSRLISRPREKALPLYRLLKKSEHFSWTLEAQEALDKLKALLTTPPILVPPAEGEPLLLRPLTRWLVRLLWSKGRKRGTPYQSRDRYTSLVKYFLILRPDTYKYKSYSMQ
jgi:hypothetical protein